MADQTADVISFIWQRHPELDPEDISKVVTAITEWLDKQTEDNDGNDH